MSVKWNLAEPDPEAVESLAERAGLHPLIARLLVLRGISDHEAAHSYLSGGMESLADPAIFLGMERATERTRTAITAGEKIVVYGDYDVDGVSGTSLLYLALKSLGANVGAYIPDRVREGYGLNANALGTIKASGAGLVISVDCGITAAAAADAARAIGLDLIITDHHEMTGQTYADVPRHVLLPSAYAILHPGLVVPGTPDAVRESVAGLTGVGIAYKFVQHVLGAAATDERLLCYVDLVTLGTIADVGKITGENRILVKEGLERLSGDSASLRPGIAALKRVAGLDNKKIGVGNVGFSLGPRINAGGRIESADTAFRLLTTSSPAEADELAAALDAVNRERQALEESILADAREACRKFDMASTGAIVLWSESWHPGVIGIVASRIAEEFYRPTALLSVRDGVAKGSGRSIPGFDLYAGLSACSDLLAGFGGHKYAAGMTIDPGKLDEFRGRLSSIVIERMGSEGFVRTLSVDAALAPSELTMDLMRDIEALGPFGQGNPEPRLGARGLEVVDARIVGKNHLKCTLRMENGKAMSAIAFNRGGMLNGTVRRGSRLAVVFTPRVNTWNGSTSLEMEIRDIKQDRGIRAEMHA